MSILDKLNPMQQEAVRTIDGPLLLLAGAGSGKTRVLVHRMAYLVENGIDPYNILAITFTNKAAKEMKERVESIIPGGSSMWVSTFHSSCVRILRREIEQIGFSKNFTIYDTQDAEKLMKEIIRELNISDKHFPSRAVMYEISRQKDELITPDDFLLISSGDVRMQKIAQIYKAYQQRLKANNALDFDDIICKTVELFAQRPDILEHYQIRFKYIMVDEYQDTNTAQYQLIRFLSSRYENLCVVGDDDQSIYGWRGANIQNILDFEKDFPLAKVIRLEQNYRSTSTILNAANAVIKNNKERKGKNLWTEKEGGAAIMYFRADTDIAESMYVADTILRSVKTGGNYKDFAVLYRTNSQSRVFEETLFKNGMPYRICGGIRFYERREILDLLAYLKIVANPTAEIPLRRIINVPKRGIGDTTVAKFSEYALANGITLYESLKKADEVLGKSTRIGRIYEFVDLMETLRADAEILSVSELLRKIIDTTSFIQGLQAEKSEKEDDAEDRIKNVQELVSKTMEFEKQSESSTLSAFLEEISLVADIDNYNESDNAMVLMTLHSAKGLEFPNVFIVGFEENVFPGYRAVTSGTNKEMEEERRLCYVGITRAKERLYLTTAVSRRQNGMYVSNPPSRFLKEIPQECIQGGAQRKDQAKKPRQVSYEQLTGQGFPFSRDKKAVPVEVPVLSKEKLTFEVGDYVVQQKYGRGAVLDIRAAGADYEVTVEFPGAGKKKFMAHLANLRKDDE